MPPRCDDLALRERGRPDERLGVWSRREREDRRLEPGVDLAYRGVRKFFDSTLEMALHLTF